MGKRGCCCRSMSLFVVSAVDKGQVDDLEIRDCVYVCMSFLLSVCSVGISRSRWRRVSTKVSRSDCPSVCYRLVSFLFSSSRDILFLAGSSCKRYCRVTRSSHQREKEKESKLFLPVVDGDLGAVNEQGAVLGLDVALVATVGGVVLEHVDLRSRNKTEKRKRQRVEFEYSLLVSCPETTSQIKTRKLPFLDQVR